MSVMRRAGRMVGLLLLVQLAAGLIVPYVLLQPLSASGTAFLERAASMSAMVRINVLVPRLGVAVSIAVAVTAWPVVRTRRSDLGIWLLALAVVNFTLQIIENAQWLSMLSLSQAYAAATGAEAATMRPLAVVVRASWRWAHYSHILVVVGWLFTTFLTLFRCALVPRGLGVFGMFCSVLHTIGITLPVFTGYRMVFPELFGMPLALAILSIAVWLLTRGFDEATPAVSGA
ncbi:MAG: DUF4386 family protein [Acidobacteria bacterium]|nr:MAG: DUF4386 family protein [Acidobacteriota bacterium]